MKLLFLAFLFTWHPKSEYTPGKVFLQYIEVIEPGYDRSYIKIFDSNNSTDTLDWVGTFHTDIYNPKTKGYYNEKYILIAIQFKKGCLIKSYGEYPSTIKARFLPAK